MQAVMSLCKITFHQSAGYDKEEHLDQDILGLEIPVGDRRLQTLALVGSKLTWFVKGYVAAGK